MSKFTTEQYLKTLENNAGHININKNKFLDDQPDYGGFVKIEDKIYRVSAWMNSKTKNISFRLKEVTEL